jgi:Protein of unknown function (DUF1501)
VLRIYGYKNEITRRSFVQAGLLGVGGLTLDALVRPGSARAALPARDKSVILFWLSGGPGHMETWDPKPEAVAGVRGPFGAIRTSVPGVRFGELLPHQARVMDRIAILRTVNHGSGDHTKSNHWMLTGFEGPAFNAPDFRTQRRPSMGSAVSHLSSGRRTGMPPYVAVPHLRGGTDNFFHYAAYLGGGANPFVTEADPNKPDFRVRNLTLPGAISLPRLEDRRQLLSTLDNLRQIGEAQDLAEHRRGAFDLLTSPAVARAFDIASESDRVRDQYGRHTFGQSALLARRLVEAQVPFVTVNCVPWDHHGTGGNLPTVEGAKLVIPPFDQALAALIEDLIQRGLYDRTLVVAMGEFGRTPRMNSNAGRDHWGKTFSVLMGSGSMRMGQVIGSTNARGEHPVDRSISPQDVTATVFHHLGIDAAQVMFHDVQDKPLPLVESGRPIRELLL